MSMHCSRVCPETLCRHSFACDTEGHANSALYQYVYSLSQEHLSYIVPVQHQTMLTCMCLQSLASSCLRYHMQPSMTTALL